MKPQYLTPEENAKLTEDLTCPDCNAQLIIFGPRGAGARNCLCAGCRTEFCGSLVQSERVAQPCDPERALEMYGLGPNDHPIKSFTLLKPLTRKQLDEATCNNPNCKDPTHHVLTLAPCCHRRSAVLVSYNREDGILSLHCAECNRPVVKISVAP